MLVIDWGWKLLGARAAAAAAAAKKAKLELVILSQSLVVAAAKISCWILELIWGSCGKKFNDDGLRVRMMMLMTLT